MIEALIKEYELGDNMLGGKLKAFDIIDDTIIYRHSFVRWLASRIPTWISVEDRLPDMGRIVIITDGVLSYCACRVQFDEWDYQIAGDNMESNAIMAKDVTHWMPLPKTQPNNIENNPEIQGGE